MEFYQDIETTHTHTAGHPDVEGGDASQCPHLRFMKNKGENPEKNNENTKEQQNKEQESDSDVSSDEDEAPRGGCPVLGAGKAKDPRLEILTPGFK